MRVWVTVLNEWAQWLVLAWLGWQLWHLSAAMRTALGIHEVADERLSRLSWRVSRLEGWRSRRRSRRAERAPVPQRDRKPNAEQVPVNGGDVFRRVMERAIEGARPLMDKEPKE